VLSQYFVAHDGLTTHEAQRGLGPQVEHAGPAGAAHAGAVQLGPEDVPQPQLGAEAFTKPTGRMTDGVFSAGFFSAAGRTAAHRTASAAPSNLNFMSLSPREVRRLGRTPQPNRRGSAGSRDEESLAAAAAQSLPLEKVIEPDLCEHAVCSLWQAGSSQLAQCRDFARRRVSAGTAGALGVARKSPKSPLLRVPGQNRSFPKIRSAATIHGFDERIH